MEKVQRRTSCAPLAYPFFMLILIGLEAKNLLTFQGRRGIASVVRWNLRPVIFGVENGTCFTHVHGRGPEQFGRPLKTTFDMTTLIFSSGGCPSYPFYPLKIRNQKGPTKPKNRTNSTKEFSEQFEGVTGHYPVKQGI